MYWVLLGEPQSGTALPARTWLMANIPTYLTGFLKVSFVHETSKKLQESTREEHESGAFTMSALTMAGAYVKLTIH
jgi:hypothetical protein